MILDGWTMCFYWGLIISERFSSIFVSDKCQFNSLEMHLIRHSVNICTHTLNIHVHLHKCINANLTVYKCTLAHSCSHRHTSKPAHTVYPYIHPYCHKESGEDGPECRRWQAGRQTGSKAELIIENNRNWVRNRQTEQITRQRLNSGAQENTKDITEGTAVTVKKVKNAHHCFPEHKVTYSNVFF